MTGGIVSISDSLRAPLTSDPAPSHAPSREQPLAPAHTIWGLDPLQLHDYNLLYATFDLIA